MSERNTVTAGSFFAASFAASVVSAVSLSPRMLGGNLMESLRTVPLSFLVTSCMAVPAFLLEKETVRSAGSVCFQWKGRLSCLTDMLYFSGYTFSSGYFLSFFLVFIENTLNPGVPIGVIAACIVLAAAYGAWKGFAAVTRAGIYTGALVAFGFVFMFLALTKQLQLQRMQMFSAGEWTVPTAALLIARRSMMMLDLLLFLPRVRGRKKLGFFLWNTAGHLLFALLLVFFAGVLGAFAAKQLFPVYALATMADLGAVQRLDMFFLVLWMASLVLRLSLNLAAGASLFRGKERCTPEDERTSSKRFLLIFLQGSAAGVLAAVTSQRLSWQQSLFSSPLVVYLSLFLQVLVPTAMLCACRLRRRGESAV